MDFPRDSLMQIADLATKAGVTSRTIRYYEELGLGGSSNQKSAPAAVFASIRNRSCAGCELSRASRIWALH